ncbi:MAG: acyltransferase [Magnetococcales bacterium]|nr:acyltransferase [Magnetococcales bacterium]
MIKSKKYYGLEFVRGVVAVEVAIAHFILINSELKQYPVLKLISSWAMEAVILFFVLSGIVINHSISTKKYDRSGFIRSRMIRILPAYWFSLVLTGMVQLSVSIPLPDFQTLLGNLFLVATLQGYIVDTFVLNPPAWSLSFESVFYLLIAWSFYSSRRYYRISLWVVFGLVSVILLQNKTMDTGFSGHFISIAAYSMIWLTGYAAYQWRHQFHGHLLPALFLFLSVPLASRIHFIHAQFNILGQILMGIISVPYLIYLIQSEAGNDRKEGGSKRRGWVVFACYFAVYLMLTGLLFAWSKSTQEMLYFVVILPWISFLLVAVHRLLEGRDNRIILPVGKVLGRISYPLYLFHFPIIIYVKSLFPDTIVYNILVSLTATVTLCVVFEYSVQPKINSYFNRISMDNRSSFNNN